MPLLEGFKPGQHVDVRLTAPDGYQARRSYSIASAPEDLPNIEIAIELMPGGEVSPFFHEVVEAGDAIEVRGPIGGPFSWSIEDGGPVLMLAGGSGIAPIMSMIRHRGANASEIPMGLIYSVRSLDDLLYGDELARMAAERPEVRYLPTLTRAHPLSWDGHVGRIAESWIRDLIRETKAPRWTFVCGSSGFVEAAAELALRAGILADRIRTERFGPSGL